jgi:choice-of-anchor B domain-containing protein
MKKIFLFLSILVFSQVAFSQVAFKSKNVKLLGSWADLNIPPSGNFVNSIYSSCWGYSQKGREYAIVGSHTGTYFVDITDAKNPKKVAFVKGRRDKCVWREYKTYKNFLYCVSDDGAPNSFQVVDMSYLPDSVKVVHDDVNILQQGHTVWVDKDKMYVASTKFTDGYSPMAVFSLANPAKPTLLRRIEQDSLGAPTAHDMFVKNDTCYMSGGNSGLFVYHLKNGKFKTLGSLTKYPSGGYNHATLMLPDNKHMVMLDEVPNSLPVKVINVSNLADIKVVTTFTGGTKATPHNVFPGFNNRTVITYYEDGIRIFDLKNPAKPVETGFFDTHFQSDSTNTTGAYAGAWSAYTELPSKNIIIVDMQNGLFVVDAKAAYGINTAVNDLENEVFSTISPNPFENMVKITSSEQGFFDVKIIDELGKIVFYEKNKNVENKIINTEFLTKGIYFLKISNGEKTQTEKLIKF